MKPNNHNYIEEILSLFREEKLRLFTHPKGGLSVLLDYPPHERVLDEEEVEKFIKRICESYEIKIEQTLTAYHEHFMGEVDGMKKERKCLCDELLPVGAKGYHNCGAFIGNLEVNTERVFGYNSALNDIITKLQGNDSNEKDL